jgi:hypothetical protein
MTWCGQEDSISSSACGTMNHLKNEVRETQHEWQHSISCRRMMTWCGQEDSISSSACGTMNHLKNEVRETQHEWQHSISCRRMMTWCGQEDSNFHPFRNNDLNVARLPIPPWPHLSSVRAGVSSKYSGFCKHYSTLNAKKYRRHNLYYRYFTARYAEYRYLLTCPDGLVYIAGL